ncbi:MAG TPA: hypothetical protein VFB20_13740 [Burkholderiales bacterium]|nr:hypothetical protein [Burkholderiales bacterium]
MRISFAHRPAGPNGRAFAASRRFNGSLFDETYAWRGAAVLIEVNTSGPFLSGAIGAPSQALLVHSSRLRLTGFRGEFFAAFAFLCALCVGLLSVFRLSLQWLVPDDRVILL